MEKWLYHLRELLKELKVDIPDPPKQQSKAKAILLPYNPPDLLTIHREGLCECSTLKSEPSKPTRFGWLSEY